MDEPFAPATSRQWERLREEQVALGWHRWMLLAYATAQCGRHPETMTVSNAEHVIAALKRLREWL